MKPQLTVDDPVLGLKTAYARWFVLNHLLELPANARGSGSPMSGEELYGLLHESMGEPRFDISRREMGQAARHFAVEAAGECVLWWRNAHGGEAEAFGVKRTRRPSAEVLRARYEARVAVFELEELPDDFDEPVQDPEQGERFVKLVESPGILIDEPETTMFRSPREDSELEVVWNAILAEVSTTGISLSDQSAGIGRVVVRALGGSDAAERTKNRLAFLIERGVTLRDHLAAVAAQKVAEDLARVGRYLARLEDAIDEVDQYSDDGIRRRVMAFMERESVEEEDERG